MNDVRSARLAVSSGIAFVVLLALLHVLEPGIDPPRSVVSQYQLADHGWLMTPAFLTLGSSCLGGSVALWPRVPRWSGRFGLALVVVAGVGALLAAAYATDPPGPGPGNATPGGKPHELGAMIAAFALRPAAAVWLARREVRGRR